MDAGRQSQLSYVLYSYETLMQLVGGLSTKAIIRRKWSTVGMLQRTNAATNKC
jgi:hypothetical protein